MQGSVHQSSKALQPQCIYASRVGQQPGRRTSPALSSTASTRTQASNEVWKKALNGRWCHAGRTTLEVKFIPSFFPERVARPEIVALAPASILEWPGSLSMVSHMFAPRQYRESQTSRRYGQSSKVAADANLSSTTSPTCSCEYLMLKAFILVGFIIL